MTRLRLFMLLLGCEPPGRHTEQHDIFFGIAHSLEELAPAIRSFWPEGQKLHIDGWREVRAVEGYRVTIELKSAASATLAEPSSASANPPPVGTTSPNPSTSAAPRLFFINLGGYQEKKLEEQHYILLTVADNRAAAIQAAKQTFFFQHNHFEGANSHVDDKYGIDVDDLYEIEEILPPAQKEKYQIVLTPENQLDEDPLHLGYLKLSQLTPK